MARHPYSMYTYTCMKICMLDACVHMHVYIDIHMYINIMYVNVSVPVHAQVPVPANYTLSSWSRPALALYETFQKALLFAGFLEGASCHRAQKNVSNTVGGQHGRTPS